jgi:hypothetical protein
MNPCDTCAFRPGSVTFDQEPHNRLRSELAALGAIPFYCHHGVDGTVRDLGTVTRETQRVAVQTGFMVICQGWKRAVKRLADEGYFKDSPKIKRIYAEVGLGALQVFIDEEEGPKKRRAARTLKDVILALNKARGFTEVEHG